MQVPIVEGTARLIDLQGNPVAVDPSEAPALVQQGYLAQDVNKLQSLGPIASVEPQADEGGMMAFLRSSAPGLFKPLDPFGGRIPEAITPEMAAGNKAAEEALVASKEQHPWASAGGDLANFGMLTAIPGGPMAQLGHGTRAAATGLAKLLGGGKTVTKAAEMAGAGAEMAGVTAMAEALKGEDVHLEHIGWDFLLGSGFKGIGLGYQGAKGFFTERAEKRGIEASKTFAEAEAKKIGDRSSKLFQKEHDLRKDASEFLTTENKEIIDQAAKLKEGADEATAAWAQLRARGAFNKPLPTDTRNFFAFQQAAEKAKANSKLAEELLDSLKPIKTRSGIPVTELETALEETFAKTYAVRSQIQDVMTRGAMGAFAKEQAAGLGKHSELQSALRAGGSHSGANLLRLMDFAKQKGGEMLGPVVGAGALTAVGVPFSAGLLSLLGLKYIGKPIVNIARPSLKRAKGAVEATYAKLPEHVRSHAIKQFGMFGVEEYQKLRDELDAAEERETKQRLYETNRIMAEAFGLPPDAAQMATDRHMNVVAFLRERDPVGATP